MDSCSNALWARTHMHRQTDSTHQSHMLSGIFECLYSLQVGDIAK